MADVITVEITDDEITWRRNGVIHREDGPAVLRSCGRVCWYKDGLPHREGLPANETRDEQGNILSQAYFLHGERVSMDGQPAIMHRHENGVLFAQWFNEVGEVARPEDEGPAISWWYPNGSYSHEFYLAGVQHRSQGPSVIAKYAEPAVDRPARKIFSFHRFGKMHREDGPAEIYEGGLSYFWLSGENLWDEKGYRAKLKEMGLHWQRAVTPKMEAFEPPQFVAETGYPDFEVEIELAKRFEAAGAVHVSETVVPVDAAMPGLAVDDTLATEAPAADDADGRAKRMERIGRMQQKLGPKPRHP